MGVDTGLVDAVSSRNGWRESVRSVWVRRVYVCWGINGRMKESE